ncbi:helix-turn-helix domain-containing protein [Nocardia arizonensis]|uniref:helix-turn-helix domain-containing protein n=1 Tax=Nocardia arizonensis TaxID=1141647 RepID=UPI0006D13330|nr:XRE family transcriptional regulator [Nocardia arizonensis]
MTQSVITKSYLSKVERALSTPSIAVAMKIAHALGVDVGQLFSDRAGAANIAVDRAAGPPGEQRYRTVAASMLGKSMSPFLVYPTYEFADDTHRTHSGQEFVFVHVGTIELEYGGRTTILHVGDSAYLDASIPHMMRSVNGAPAQVVVVAHNEM